MLFGGGRNKAFKPKCLAICIVTKARKCRRKVSADSADSEQITDSNYFTASILGIFGLFKAVFLKKKTLKSWNLFEIFS